MGAEPVVDVRTTRTQTIGCLGQLSIELIAVGPGYAAVDIAVACMFEHEMRGSLSGGLLHLDEALGGALSSLRREGVFPSRVGDTLLLTQLPAGLTSKALLIVGLGLPTAFSAGVLQDGMAIAARQVLRMSVRSASFSPNVLDAGFHPDELEGIELALLAGLQTALNAENRLFALGFRPPTQLQNWRFQAGGEHFEIVAASFDAGFWKLLQNQ